MGIAERPDLPSSGAEEAKPEQTGIVGGSNSRPLNDLRGSLPVAGSDGDVPSGGGRSGIGAASKPSPGTLASASANPYGVRDGTGGGQGYSLEWLQGGTRKKIAGELPVYPKATNVEAELSFYAAVDPEGTIKALLPAQKADVRLEQAVIEALRDWKFEPLASAFPQIEQTCQLRFIFRLK